MKHLAARELPSRTAEAKSPVGGPRIHLRLFDERADGVRREKLTVSDGPLTTHLRHRNRSIAPM
jgi:hypothetical protein